MQRSPSPTIRSRHDADFFSRLYTEASPSEPAPAEDSQDDDLASPGGRLSEPDLNDFEH